MAELKQCLIIPFSELPDELCQYFRHFDNFAPDTLLPMLGEWSVDWSELSYDSINSYYEDQKEHADSFHSHFGSDEVKEEIFSSFEEFIHSYSLEFEMWVLKNYVNELKTADKVLIDTSL